MKTKINLIALIIATLLGAVLFKAIGLILLITLRPSTCMAIGRRTGLMLMGTIGLLSGRRAENSDCPKAFLRNLW